MRVAKVDFSITSEHGSTIFLEGQEVPEDIAKMFPHMLEGSVEKQPPAHDPTLAQKLSVRTIEGMNAEKLLAWVKQYHPNEVPSAPMEKAKLIELVTSLQE